MSFSTRPKILCHLYHQFHDLNRILLRRRRRRRGLQKGIQLDHRETALLAVPHLPLAKARSQKATMTQGRRVLCVRWCRRHLRTTAAPVTKIQVTWERWEVGKLLALVRPGSVRRTAFVRRGNSRSRRRCRRRNPREIELDGCWARVSRSFPRRLCYITDKSSYLAAKLDYII